MEKLQVSGHSDESGWAPCKTVGLAYDGSNPSPATTSENGPRPGCSRDRGLLLSPLCRLAVSMGDPAVSSCARTYSGQRPGRIIATPDRVIPRFRRLSGGVAVRQPGGVITCDPRWPAQGLQKFVARRSSFLPDRDLAAG